MKHVHTKTTETHALTSAHTHGYIQTVFLAFSPIHPTQAHATANQQRRNAAVVCVRVCVVS